MVLDWTSQRIRQIDKPLPIKHEISRTRRCIQRSPASRQLLTHLSRHGRVVSVIRRTALASWHFGHQDDFFEADGKRANPALPAPAPPGRMVPAVWTSQQLCLRPNMELHPPLHIPGFPIIISLTNSKRMIKRTLTHPPLPHKKSPFARTSRMNHFSAGHSQTTRQYCPPTLIL